MAINYIMVYTQFIKQQTLGKYQQQSTNYSNINVLIDEGKKTIQYI